MRLRVMLLAPVLVLSLPASSLLGETQQNDDQSQQTLLHRSSQWSDIQPHLPNLDTAPAASLETAGDVLRARRFPDDALLYYKAALDKNGDVATLQDKIGVVELDLHHNGAAHSAFLASIKSNKNYAPAWNNLGVMEALTASYTQALVYYRHAAKINNVEATYHANAGMAYFETREYDKARQELLAAIQIDPEVLEKHSAAGINIQMLGRDHYGEFCFEMAKLFAGQNDADQVHLWLAKAKSNGYDLESGMRHDVVLSPYLKDPAVKLILTGARPAPHRESVSGVPSGSAPMERNFN